MSLDRNAITSPIRMPVQYNILIINKHDLLILLFLTSFTYRNTQFIALVYGLLYKSIFSEKQLKEKHLAQNVGLRRGAIAIPRQLLSICNQL